MRAPARFPLVTRRFLGWDRPLLELVADLLLPAAAGSLCDLSDCLAVVPTAHAGRRLREELARRAATTGGAVLPPDLCTPEELVNRLARPFRPADRQVALAGWLALLLRRELTDLTALFPITPGRREMSWALGCAERFLTVQNALGEAGLTIDQVAAGAGSEGQAEEPQRWAELAALEGEQVEWLAEMGLSEPNRAKARAALSCSPPSGITRIVLLATPDPMPLALTLLGRLAERLPVTVCIHASAELDDHFDEWGRPRSDHWSRAPLPLVDGQLVLLHSPEQQSEMVTGMVAGRPDGEGWPAIAAADPEVADRLAKRLGRQGIATFNPAGDPLVGHPLARLVTAAIELALGGGYREFAALLRHPHFLGAIRRHFPQAGGRRLLTQLDELYAAHLPADLEAVIRWADESLGQVARWTRDLVGKLVGEQSGRRLAEFLRTVYARRFLNPDQSHDRTFRAAGRELQELLAALDSPPIAAAGLAPAEQLRFLLHLLDKAQVADERPAEGIDLLGWLELQWEENPELIIAGMNDGFVPDSLVGDPFLPDALRGRLGLRDNARRFARDAYLLAAMAASRPTGKLTLLVGKRSEAGDPLRPSRLLFLCPTEELPERTRRLFGETAEVAPQVTPTSGWRLRLPPFRGPDRLRVTDFSRYLRCPFRFCLERCLRMESVSDEGEELDPMRFGTLCHEALERLARDDQVRDCDDPARLTLFLQESLIAIFAQQFGTSLSAPLMIQREALLQRLAFAAREQARLRQEGWRIISAEVKLSELVAEPPHLGPFPLSGRIDRIDRHEDGRIRVIDYKSSEKASNPVEKHLAAVQDETPVWARVEVEGKTRRWIDLQLPLYAFHASGVFGRPVECGYFCLPKAVTETGLRLWPDLSPDLLQSALNCAGQVAEAIADFRFWPPAHLPRDESYPFLLGDPEQSVDVDHFLALLQELRGGRP